ncbi:MAG TPA: hypothetical protein VD713_04465 [Sphingomonadales bacterium]|nr:hypothetical protein [Sphingomonadales bacterium]
MRAAAIIGIRLIAFYLIVFTLWQLGYVLAPVFFPDPASDPESLNSAHLILAFPLVFGVLVWVFAKSLADLVVRGVGEKTPPSVSEQGWVSVGTFLLGIYGLLSSLPEALVRSYYTFTQPSPWSAGSFLESLISVWAVVAFSVLLMAASGRLGATFTRLRRP